MSTRKSFTVVLAFGVFLTLTAGAFASTETDYDHSVNFEKYQTFAWRNDRMPANGIVNNSIIKSRLQRAVDEQLMRRGMREDNRNPDVYVITHLGAKNMADLEYFPAYGGRYWRWMGPDV